MTVEKVKNCFFEILEEIGIYIDICERKEDIDLTEYLIDSLQYIYIIVELEEKLGVQLSDEIILYDNLVSMNGFANMVVKVFESAANPRGPDSIGIENGDGLC